MASLICLDRPFEIRNARKVKDKTRWARYDWVEVIDGESITKQMKLPTCDRKFWTDDGEKIVEMSDADKSKIIDKEVEDALYASIPLGEALDKIEAVFKDDQDQLLKLMDLLDVKMYQALTDANYARFNSFVLLEVQKGTITLDEHAAIMAVLPKFK